MARTVVESSCYGTAANHGGDPIMKLTGAKMYFDMWGNKCSRTYCRAYSA